MPLAALNDTGRGLHEIYRIEPCGQKKADKIREQLRVDRDGDPGCKGLNQPSRLPGTINHKNGATAKNIRIDVLKRYVPEDQTDAELDILPLTKRAKELIRSGRDIKDDETKGKSEARMAVLLELLQAGADFEDLDTFLMMETLYTTPEKWRGKIDNERWREKEIAAAEEFFVKFEGWLFEMNKDRFWTMQTGSTVICSRVYDPAFKRTKYEFSPHSGLAAYYANKYVEFAGRWMTMYEAWKRHPKRSEHPLVIFDPALPPGVQDDNVFNIWQGFAVKPRQGDTGLVEEFIFEIISNGDDVFFEYAMNYLARTVQLPGERGEVAFVMRGDKGTGKGTLATMVGDFFGEAYLHLYNQDHLTGNFTEHLRGKCVVFGDEIFFAGDKRHEGQLKGFITEPTLPINQKFLPLVVEPNRITFFMAANADWAVPASQNERRYAVTNVSDKRMQDHKYFAKLAATDRSAFLWMLMDRDISKFNHRLAPDSEGLRDQKMQSMNAFDKWLVDYLMEGVTPLPDHFDTIDRCPTKLMFEHYQQFRRTLKAPGDCPTTIREFGHCLKQATPDGFPRRTNSVSWQMTDKAPWQSGNLYRFPALAEWRNFVAEAYLKQPIDWPAVVAEIHQGGSKSITELKAKAFDLEQKFRDAASGDPQAREYYKEKLTEVTDEIRQRERKNEPDSNY